MSDSASSDALKDDELEARRADVPIPGVIDLDSVDADARQALWGSQSEAVDPDTVDPDTEDETPPGADDLHAVRPPATVLNPRVTMQAPADHEMEADRTLTPPDPPPAPSASIPPTHAGSTPPHTTRWEDDTAHRTKPSTVPETSEITDANAASTTAPISKENPKLLTGGTATVTQESLAPDPLRPPEAVVQTAKEATKDRGRELVSLVTEYGKRHIPEAPPGDREPDTGPPRLVGRIGQIIPILRVLPWLLGAVFAWSFFWDFPTAEMEVLGRVISLEGLLRILSVSGLIGFLTNWLAITMLFQPREKRAIIPQGLIPAQRERVIYRLSDAISRELINADIIKQKIQDSGVIGRYRDLGLSVVRGVVEDPDFRADLKALAQRFAQETLGSEELRRELAQIAVDKVEEQAGQGLGGVALKLYRTFAEDDFQRRVDKALSELPQAVTPLLDRIDEALDAIPEKVEARGDKIEEAATKAVLSFVEGFDIQAMIREKARGFDEAQLENLLKSTSNEQLNYIKYLGGILGVFGGLVIWRAEMLIVFVAVGLVLWALDEIIVRARRRRVTAPTL